MSEIKNISLTIDGRLVTVPEGTKVIEAAKQVHVDIPHYCYHKNLSSPAVCRMCLVEVEGIKKLQPSCNMPVTEGLVVRTNSENVKKAVQEVLEFTLINHPLDCPVCDQAGECGLHDYYQEYGLYNSRFTLPKVNKPKVQDIGPTLVLDAERCILCSRCVRFSEEVTKTNEMAIIQRGDHSTISAVQEVKNPYSTNLADICPVGALTQKDFRFKVRVWYLESTPSLCTGCSRGCNTTVDHYRGKIQRVRPRENPFVNQTWMCDEGRILYKDVDSFERLKQPLLKKGRSFVEISWEEAFEWILQILRKGNVVGQGSAHVSNEDAFAFATLLEKISAPKAAQALEGKQGWENDALLQRQDRTPNQAGSRWFNGLQNISEWSNSQKTLWILQDEPVLKNLSFSHMIYVGTHRNPTAQLADLVLPIATWAEYSGTFINCEGRIQAFQQIVKPPEKVMAPWKLFNEILIRLGGTVWSNSEEVFQAIQRDTKVFEEISFSEISGLGVQNDAFLSQP